MFEALNGSKLLYSEMEKMAYAVVMAPRKLRHYFQSFNIKVPTSYHLWDMFENREASGRIGKWATQLAAHTIDFVPRSAIKSPVLIDFVADWTPAAPLRDSPDDRSHMAVGMRWSILPERLGGFGSSHRTFGHPTQVRS